MLTRTQKQTLQTSGAAKCHALRARTSKCRTNVHLNRAMNFRPVKTDCRLSRFSEARLLEGESLKSFYSAFTTAVSLMKVRRALESFTESPYRDGNCVTKIEEDVLKFFTRWQIRRFVSVLIERSGVSERAEGG